MRTLLTGILAWGIAAFVGSSSALASQCDPDSFQPDPISAPSTSKETAPSALLPWVHDAADGIARLRQLKTDQFKLHRKARRLDRAWCRSYLQQIWGESVNPAVLHVFEEAVQLKKQSRFDGIVDHRLRNYLDYHLKSGMGPRKDFLDRQGVPYFTNEENFGTGFVLEGSVLEATSAFEGNQAVNLARDYNLHLVAIGDLAVRRLLGIHPRDKVVDHLLYDAAAHRFVLVEIKERSRLQAKLIQQVVEQQKSTVAYLQHIVPGVDVEHWAVMSRDRLQGKVEVQNGVPSKIHNRFGRLINFSAHDLLAVGDRTLRIVLR